LPKAKEQEGVKSVKGPASVIVDKWPVIKMPQEGVSMLPEQSHVLIDPRRMPEVNDTLIRDPLDTTPEVLKKKGGQILIAAIGVQDAGKAIEGYLTGMERNKLRSIRDKYMAPEHLGRIAGRIEARREAERDWRVKQRVDWRARQFVRDLGDISDEDKADADTAYRDYLRKRALLSEAWHTYVASVNPQPVSGSPSGKAIEAALSIWIVQDMLRDSIHRALAQGKTLDKALVDAQQDVERVVSTLGISQAQLTSAVTTVLSELALANMTEESVKAYSLAETHGLTETQIATRVGTAIRTSLQSITQTAINSGTLTQSQVNELENALEREGEAVRDMTLQLKVKLPIPSDKIAGALTKEQLAGAISRKQGFMFITVYPPFGQRDRIYTRRPIAGVPIYRGKGSAYKAITRRGEVPPVVTSTQGIMNVTIRTPDVGRPRIEFSRLPVRLPTRHTHKVTHNRPVRQTIGI